MAENDPDIEKTLPPSERKLEQARESGSGLKAPDLMMILSLSIIGIGFWTAKGDLQIRWSAFWEFGNFWSRAEGLKLHAMGAAIASFAAVCVSILCVASIISAFAAWALNGFIFSSKAISLDLTRLDPFARIGEMFSAGGTQVWWPLIKGLVSLGLMVVGVKLFSEAMLNRESPVMAFLHAAAPCAVGFLLFSLMDFFLQVWRRAKSLGMTLQELKDEMRESEGDPMIKAKIRAIARQRARSRMMSAVVSADVVVVNPEHYLVALRWDAKRSDAPLVVAKARDLLAVALRDRARLEGVPVMESPPFARALFAASKMDQAVPLNFYEPIAVILAWAYGIKDGRSLPEPLVAIPAEGAEQ